MTENQAPALPQQQPPPQRKSTAPSRQPEGSNSTARAPHCTPVAAEKGPSPATSSKKKPQKQFRNGYEVSPQALSFVPYKLEKKARKRAKPFSFEDGPAAKQPRKHTKVTVDRWNKLAREAGVLPVDATLREFQIQCANLVLQAGRDICVIAPTGAGKSMLWCLPVLAQPRTISLVITPYTSLGEQGEADMNRCGISSIFINADQNSETDLQNVARGVYKVVFICVESVETPRFARVLYSKTFKEALQGIYIDEAHLVKESLDWRPGYQRLGQLRTVVGRGAPLVAISATLPSSYRSALCTHAGLGTEHHLINLGNIRNELSLVVRPLQYSGTFQDLAFTVPTGASSATIVPTLVYYDDTLKLTDMLWWYQHRLQSAGIPDTLVDIIHAGLSSTHQERALNSFREGRTKILLATEKIGAGIHLPRVERVVQYLARNNLTLAKLDQRRGRGARTRGMTAICYFLVEPELIGGDPSTLPEATDPGILALVRADGCYQDVLDHWLENPIRQRPFTYDMAARLCCSHCQPDLAAIQEYQWIAVDPEAQVKNTSSILPEAEQEAALAELHSMRLTAWREQWRVKWRGFGPKSLIANSDLKAVAKVATAIHSLDDLRPITHIPYWNDFAPWLLSAVQAVVLKLRLAEDSGETDDREKAQEEHETFVGSAQTNSATTNSTKPRRRRNVNTNPRTLMHHAEMLIEF